MQNELLNNTIDTELIKEFQEAVKTLNIVLENNKAIFESVLNTTNISELTNVLTELNKIKNEGFK